jgi:hypothetical protein
MDSNSVSPELAGVYDRTSRLLQALLGQPIPAGMGSARSAPRGDVQANFTSPPGSLAAGAAAAVDLDVYDDALGSGWSNWSWNTTVSLNNPAPVYSGSASMSVTFDAAWAGLNLHIDDAVDTVGYGGVRFYLHGGSTGNQQVMFCTYDGNNHTSTTVPLSLLANTWNQVDVSVSALGNPAVISNLVWQDTSGHAQPVFYLDQVSLIRSGSVPGLSLHVDAAAGQHSISPDIYGINFVDEALAAELHLPVRRFGGNTTTRYNWQIDTSNLAVDWFFENLPGDNPNPGALPDGSETDRFVEQDQRTGTRTLLTVPLIGWTPKNRAKAGSFSVTKYGPQQSVDQYFPDCGNGVRPDGTLVTHNDPTDTSMAIAAAFIQDWIGHLTAKYGRAAEGGVAYYCLDNEPMLWNTTHRDVHPQPTSYDELRDQTYLYGRAVKTADPTAKTLGPVEWGWTGYFYSALDSAAGGNWWENPQDRNAHGGQAFTEWYLDQMHSYEQSNGVRILDYLDEHYYPAAPEGVALPLSSAGDEATKALRLRSTRSLWDKTYIDDSWINAPIYLLPRMHDWIDQHYPGTKLAISEYNWGGQEDINGALAQADVLGIFGREQLDLATLWAPGLTSDQPGVYALRMYRNYDGAGSGFGDTSVSATSDDQGQLAIYAATRSTDGALTLTVINKTNNDLVSNVALNGFSPASPAQVYRYSPTNLNAIVRQSDQAVTTGGFTADFPKTSITLFVIPR